MRSKEFVDYLFSLLGKDKGLRACFKRADNEAYEWKTWQVLRRFVNLEHDDERRAFALIGACIAKSKQEANGSVGLGRACRIAAGNEDDDFSPRFMRLLSAESADELLVVLRPSLAYLVSKCGNLDFAGILDDILAFKWKREKIRVCWAKDYLNNDDGEVDDE